MIDHAELVEFLRYDADTGHFYWRKRTAANCKLESPAGYLASRPKTRSCWSDYWIITLAGKRYKAHRLAWFYVNREWPPEAVDHINGDGLDNRIGNLRLASHAQNMANARGQQTNSSGVKGVSWAASRSKWRACIKIGGKFRSLGYFSTIAEAKAAYEAAASAAFGAFSRHVSNHGTSLS